MSSKLITYTLPVLLFSVIWGAVEFLVPIRYSEANISVELVAFLFSLSSAISLVLDIPAGKLSDRIGREKLIVYSMMISVAALLLLYLYASFYAFLGASILIGIAYGLNWSPLLAFVGDRADTHENHGSVFADFFTLSALGEAVAPLALAVMLFRTSNAFPFLLLAIAALLCAFIFIRLSNSQKNVPAPTTTISEHLSYKSSWNLLKKSDSKSLFLLALGFFVAFFWQSVWFVQPLIGFYEHTLFDSALIVAAFSLPSILFSKPLGTFIDRVGEKKVFFYSIVCIIVSFICFYFSASIFAKIAYMFIAAIGVLGVWLILDILATKLNKKEERGEFFGILETVRDISYAVTPLFIGFSYTIIGLNGVFLANAAISVILLFIGIVVFKRNHHEKN